MKSLRSWLAARSTAEEIAQANRRRAEFAELDNDGLQRRFRQAEGLVDKAKDLVA